MKAQLDGKKTDISGNAVSTDGQAVFFTRVDLKKLLSGHQAILGLDEYLGAKVPMQFDIPDPSPIYGACGQERFLKRK